MSQQHIEHMQGVQGLQPRSQRSIHLIKTAKTCATCENHYLAEGQRHNSFSKPAYACHLHNCKVERAEWCKYHKRRG